MAYEIIEWFIAVIGLIVVGLSKNKKLQFLKLPIELLCFVFVILALLIEFWIDPFYDVSYSTFALVFVFSFYYFRDMIRATLVFATNIFLHESLWFVEGGFKYWNNFTDLQLLNYLILPLVLLPLYLYYTGIHLKYVGAIIFVFSAYMIVWNLAGLPDTIYTPQYHLLASLFDMGSWIIISWGFINLERKTKLKLLT